MTVGILSGLPSACQSSIKKRLAAREVQIGMPNTKSASPTHGPTRMPFESLEPRPNHSLCSLPSASRTSMRAASFLPRSNQT